MCVGRFAGSQREPPGNVPPLIEGVQSVPKPTRTLHTFSQRCCVVMLRCVVRLHMVRVGAGGKFLEMSRRVAMECLDQAEPYWV